MTSKLQKKIKSPQPQNTHTCTQKILARRTKQHEATKTIYFRPKPFKSKQRKYKKKKFY